MREILIQLLDLYKESDCWDGYDSFGSYTGKVLDGSLKIGFGGLYQEDSDESFNAIEVDGVVYVATFVDGYTGAEGQGEDCEAIFAISVKNAVQIEYYKLDGWYGSYSGTEWDSVSDLEHVTPEPQTVIAWV